MCNWLSGPLEVGLLLQIRSSGLHWRERFTSRGQFFFPATGWGELTSAMPVFFCARKLPSTGGPLATTSFLGHETFWFSHLKENSDQAHEATWYFGETLEKPRSDHGL